MKISRINGYIYTQYNVIFKYFLILTLIFLVSCSDGQKADYITEIINGITYTHNLSDAAITENVRLEFVTKIGGLDETDINYIMSRVSDVAVDKNQNIYVVDYSIHQILKYNQAGEYLSTIGRQGLGPGEFQRPYSIDIDRNGNIFVVNMLGGLIMILDDNGKEIRRFRTNGGVGSVSRIISSDKWITSCYPYENILDKKEEDKYPIFKIYSITTGERILKFGKPAILKSGEFFAVDRNVFYDISDDNYIYTAYQYYNKIEKWDINGNLVAVFDRKLPFSESDYKMENWVVTYPNSVSMGIGIDQKSNVWTATLNKQPETLGKRSLKTCDAESAHFELFTQDGVLIGSVPLPESFHKMRIIDDKLYLIDKDQVGVSVYKIVYE